MLINNTEQSDYLKVIWVMLLAVGVSQAHAKSTLDDYSLSEQADGMAKLSPIIISAVKQDVQQSIEQQNSVQQQIAQEQADKAKKDEIYSTVLTDYEWQKKDPNSNKASDKYLKPYEKYKFIEIGYNPYQRHDVRITTDDRVTIYIGHEIDGVGFVGH
ncbi:MAG: hypothetical protein RR605_11430 [Acinetobacter sp.]